MLATADWDTFSCITRCRCSDVESKLAQQLRQELAAAVRAMTPEQRLATQLEHCQLVMELYRQGQTMRAEACGKHP
jgi:hypothetical protein